MLLRAFGAKPRRVNAGNGRNRRSREYWELDVHRAPIRRNTWVVVTTRMICRRYQVTLTCKRALEIHQSARNG